MTYLESLWSRMFGQAITPLEESVMRSVSQRVDRDAQVMTLAAILVRMLYLVLLENKASPFRILANFGQAMEENRRKTALVTETYERLQRDISGLSGTIHRAENALAEARELAEAKVGYHPMFGFVPAENRGEVHRLKARHFALLFGACFSGMFLGCATCFMIFVR